MIIILFVLIAIASFIVQLFLPWWTMVVMAALLSFFLAKNMKHAFWSGFFACGLVWLIYALYITMANGNLMTVKISSLLSLPGTWTLYLISFLVAAIVGGLGAFTGLSFRKLLKS